MFLSPLIGFFLFVFFQNFSTENHGQNEYDAEQTFASEQGDGSAGGDQGIDGSNSGPILYNYHSFMRNKTRTIRWSKQETDVFYEVFTMIILLVLFSLFNEFWIYIRIFINYLFQPLILIIIFGCCNVVRI